eukprot:gb/GECH01012998.1/.p1 GENE.gb/GECH01012998.1/~~gb/GECH01012998.1/.p1  ORF type:complete len:1075 (+),score=379.19 gb/GECH01012998.1/:1-3225(+)
MPMNWMRRRGRNDSKNSGGAEEKKTPLKMNDMPEASVVTEKFEKLMDDMNIPQDKRPVMLSKPLGEKWKLICLQDQAKKQEDRAGKIQESPQYFVHNLRDKPTLTALRTLGVLLKTKAVSWVKQFLELGGLNVLFELLIANELKSNKSEEENQLQSECVYCLRALMNTEPGLKAFMESKDTMRNIALSLDSKNTKTRTQVLLLLAVVCNYSEEGFFLVLDAMNHYKLVKREKTRFQHLMDSLKNEVDVEHKIACMIFINALITSPNDGATRKMLKSEFVNLGINNIIKELGRVESLDETLNVQLTVFQEEVEGEDLDASGSGDDDPYDMMKRLEMSLKGSDAWDLFVSAFSSLVTLSKTTDAAETRSLWQKLLSFTGELQGGPDSGSGNSSEPTSKELQLQERVMTQNQMISDLETQVSKLQSEVNEERDKVLADIEKIATGAGLESTSNEKGSGSGSDWRQKVNGLLEKISQQGGTAGGGSSSGGGGASTEETKKLKEEISSLQKEIDRLKSSSGGSGDGGGQSTSGGDTKSGGDSNDQSNATEQPKADPPTPPPPPGGAPAPPPPPPPPGGGAAPPPPPPPPGGGPPPPPPPPGGGPPGAPPPPGAGPGANFGLPPLPEMKPKKKLKGYYWNKIPPAKVKNTIWMKEDIATSIDKIEIPKEDLEETFEAKKAAALPTEGSDSKPKEEKAKVIDPKKAQNVGILVAGMRMSNEQIKKYLLEMNEDKISVQNLKSLAHIAPTADEIAALNEHASDPDKLDSPDRFLFDMKDIPNLDKRLDSWAFKRKFATAVEDTRPGINDMVKATKEVRESAKFKKLLTIILAIGNYMNGGNKQRGNVYGVKLQSLMKMRDTKSKDNKTTLLRWMVSYIEKDHRDILDFEDEVNHVPTARRISVPSVQQEITELRNGIKMCKSQKEAAEKANISGDKFPEVMAKFIQAADREFDKLEKEFEDMKERLEETAQLYGEDPKTFSPEEFFGMLADFFSAFHEALNLNKKERERAEKAKKQGQGLNIPSKSKKSGDGSQDGRGVLDGQLDSLVSGSGFKRRKGNQPPAPDMNELNAALRKTGKKLVE